MIPRVIHYCWFGGGAFSELEEKCVASWKKYCPDYEIVRWDESNYDVHKCKYMSQAYDAKKWGFVSDYTRLDVVYTYGGIYLDTDVELVKSLDDILNNEFFCGLESETTVNFGLGFGAMAGHKLLAEMMRKYERLSFLRADAMCDLTPSPYYQSLVLRENGFVLDSNGIRRDGVSIYPRDYFNPKSWQTGEVILTENSYSIHHYTMSWYTEGQKKLRIKTQRIMRRYSPRAAKVLIIPYRVYYKIQDVGLKAAFQLAVGKLHRRKKKE